MSDLVERPGDHSGWLKPESRREWIRFRNKWLQLDANRYGVMAVASTGVAIAGPVIAAVLEVWDGTGLFQALVLGAGGLGAVGTWLFKNAQRDEGQLQQQADTDGLLEALDETLVRLPEVASAGPDDELSKIYVEQVAAALRRRLEPEGPTNCVRVSVYRREEQEFVSGRDGPEDEAEELETDVVSEFVRYVFVRGRRTDEPRRRFRDDEEPGRTFMPPLFTKGRFAVAAQADFPGDPARYPDGARPDYCSFVNYALTDADGKTYAMLTCDATEEGFFDERREQLIRAFSRLVGLALSRGATNAQISRPLELDS